MNIASVVNAASPQRRSALTQIRSSRLTRPLLRARLWRFSGAIWPQAYARHWASGPSPARVSSPAPYPFRRLEPPSLKRWRRGAAEPDSGPDQPILAANTFEEYRGRNHGRSANSNHFSNHGRIFMDRDFRTALPEKRSISPVRTWQRRDSCGNGDSAKTFPNLLNDTEVLITYCDWSQDPPAVSPPTQSRS
jgi:hypothetical protein